MLALLLAGCVTSGHGRVNVTASTAIWGGAMTVGGAAVGAGQCKPSSERCEHVERGDPMFASALVISGVALLGLAYLFDRAH